MIQIQKILPILQWLPNYKRSYLSGDLFAGLTVGIMLIPQGMAYALIAGLPPVYGLYASIVPQVIYALLGTSRQLSVAPVAMDSLLVAAGVSVLAVEGSEAYIEFALLLAFFMGLFQLLLGVFRMGFITNLLSKPVISGFTSAAALIIGLNQLKYLIGVPIEKSTRVYEIVWNAVRAVGEIHWVTLVIGLAAIVFIKLIKRIHAHIPGALLAVIMGILLVSVFQLNNAGVSVVGDIPRGLPTFQLPNFAFGEMGGLVPLALTISVVAFMESYAVAKAIEGRKRNYKVVPNQELVALGAANLIGSLFQSYPVAGGFSRSAVNEQSGANTPLSSLVSAVLIGLTLLFLTPLFYYLPKAVLGAVIMVAVSSLIDYQYARRLWKEHKVEFGLLLVTFLVTLNFSMIAGIVTGVILSVLILLYRTAYPHIAVLGRLEGKGIFRNVQRFEQVEIWDDRLIIRIDAPITFINIQYVKEFIEGQLRENPEVLEVLLDASAVHRVDASAILGLEDLIAKIRQRKVQLKMAGLIGPVRDIFHRSGLIRQIGVENIFMTLQDALEGEKSIQFHYQKKALQHGAI